MNPEWKAKWIAALRSGKYQQTTGALRRVAPFREDSPPIGMCCLGVLCDIVDPQGWGEVREQGTQEFLGDTALPPRSIYEIVDIGYCNETFIELPSKNDGGSTFLEIADLIEANL